MKPSPIVCQYCNKFAELVPAEIMYPRRHDLRGKSFYRCVPCDAHVGCHPGTYTPLGSLANKPLRTARIATHDKFDQLWHGGAMPRWAAYKWLRCMMNMTRDECHIGLFSEGDCKRAIAHVDTFMAKQSGEHMTARLHGKPRPQRASGAIKCP